MKQLCLVLAAICLGLAVPGVYAQDKPGGVVTEETEAVVTVREVDYQARTVTLQGEDGQLVTMKVPPEAQNLDQVYAGAKFRVRYLQSVAVYISPRGGEPSANVGAAMQLAPKGATPGGVMVEVKRVQARVDAIDYDNRIVALTGPQGNTFKFKVDDSVKRLNEVNVGDMVVVDYTQAFAMKMIKE